MIEKIFFREVVDVPIYNARISEIDAAETRRYAGLSRAEKFDEQNIIDACQEALLLLKVRGVWKIYDYDSENHLVLSDPHFKIEGNSIVKHLSDCEKVVCMALTVGNGIEREVTEKFRTGHYVSSMLLDAAATAAVEQAADETEKAISIEVAKDGYKMKSRYSPGYGDWALISQKKFFPITGAKEIGMKLSIAMMLMPRKSITAIIGLKKVTAAEKNSGADENHNCETCDKSDCPARKD